MNMIEVLENQKTLLQNNLKLKCSKCQEEYFSPFDRLYILVKGECYICNEDEKLAENILNNI